MWRRAGLLAVVLVAACGGGEKPQGGGGGQGPQRPSSGRLHVPRSEPNEPLLIELPTPADAGEEDAGPAEVEDAGVVVIEDAGAPVDAGPGPVDAGVVVSAPPDAGAADAGVVAGSGPDAGTPPRGRLALHEGPALPPPVELLTPAQGLGAETVDASLDAAGNLWAVDRDRLYVRRGGLGAVEHFDTRNGLTADPLLSVSGGEAGVAWVGHRGQGDANEDPLWMRSSGGVDRAQLSGAELVVKHYELSSPPGTYPQYPDGRYKLRSVWRAYAYKQGPYLGRAWFGCNHGVAVVAKGNVYEHHHPGICTDKIDSSDCTLHTGDVPAIAFTADGDLWFGGTYGVMKLDYSTPTGTAFWGAEPVRNLSLWQKPLKPNQYGSEDIAGLAVAPDGTLWAASRHSGLAHLLADNKTVEVYLAADGLPANELEDIAVDGAGRLWLATSKQGLVRLDLQTGEWRRAPGLPSLYGKRVVHEQIPGDSKVIAVVRGAVVVYPGALEP